ncbi:MAG: helix-turn-helix transcriptional regulator [Myxococcales bacterium]|nr:helix-turn-helix transcriptional regulator [Myxococcales bacterium]
MDNFADLWSDGGWTRLRVDNLGGGQESSVQYTDVMKARMIKRLTGPDAVTANALAAQTGIPQPTLSRWLREAGTVRPVGRSSKKTTAKTKTRASSEAKVSRSSGSSPTPKRAQDWTPQQKVQLVLEAAALSELELGAMLRREGLHREQLDKWRQQVIEGATTALQSDAKSRKRSTGPSPEHKRIRELERQLHRKDKALAETTALLVLKKKFEALFEDEEPSTPSKSGS